MNVYVFSLALAAISCAATAAQEPLWSETGVWPGGLRFHADAGGGLAMATLGDLDGDGFEDLATLGTAGWSPHTSVLIFVSGKKGDVIRTRLPQSTRPFFWLSTAGDVDGDGTHDYALTIGDSCCARPIIVQMCSAADDRVLWEVSGGWYTAFGWGSQAAGMDLDGNGRPDLVVGAPRDRGDGLGTVFAYDDRGQPLWTTRGTAALTFGDFFTPSGIGDVNGDGCDDVAIGGVDYSVSVAGAAVVLSGRDGRVLSVTSKEYVRLGYESAPAGDINGDGVPDFVTIDGHEWAMAICGRTGAPIWTWNWGVAGFGAVAGSGIDLDRDSVPDVLLGCPGARTERPNLWGRLHAFSGRDGSRLFEITNRVDRPAPRLGERLAVVDRPGETSTFVELSPGFQFPNSFPAPIGRISLYRGFPAGTEIYAPGCGSPAPKIGVRTFESLTTDRGRRVHLSGAPPGASAILLLGFSSASWLGHGLPLPLDALGLPGCSLATSVDLTATATTGTTGIDRGYAFVDLPNVGTVERGALHAQWLVLDSQPGRIGVMSDALRVQS
jgi:hypothetical protein